MKNIHDLSPKEVGDLAKSLVSAKLTKMGAKVEIPIGNKNIVKVKQGDGSKDRLIRVKSRRSGDWQIPTTEGRPPAEKVDEREFWVLVDFSVSSNSPDFYVMPGRWLRRNIHEDYQRYLLSHGGSRPVTPKSTHHKVELEQVIQWKDKWDCLELVRSKKHGENTAIFGQWLTEYLEENPNTREYLVYYDHGDPTQYSNVAEIKGIYGDKVSNATELAQVDVMVALPDREIVTLVEIEENFSDPKKLVGDIFTLLMCNQFSVRVNGEEQYFRVTPKTNLIIAGTIETKGSKREQLEKVILPRLDDFTTPSDTVKWGNIDFIFRESIKATIDEIKKLFEQRFVN